MSKSSINYLSSDHERMPWTWTITTGCTPASPGCQRCWAEKLIWRLPALHDWTDKYVKVADGTPRAQRELDPRPIGFDSILIHSNRIADPLHWKRARMVGVNFLGDLFHEAVPYEAHSLTFTAAYLADCHRRRDSLPLHRYLFLTKRPERMVASWSRWLRERWKKNNVPVTALFPNWWFGVSVCKQAEVKRCLGIALAGMHFPHVWVSIEPMLEKIVIPDPWLNLSYLWPTPWKAGTTARGVEWIVCGAESGAGARRMDFSWVRRLMVEARRRHVPFYLKQLSKGDRWPGAVPRESPWGNPSVPM